MSPIQETIKRQSDCKYPAEPQPVVERMLRDMAFVLQMTRKVKNAILAENIPGRRENAEWL